MAEHGGYRKPRKPAPVSGPGRLSRRTDGGPAQNVVPLPNAGYGENRDYQEMAAGAPMAASPPPAAPAAGPAAPGGLDLATLLGGAGAPAAPPTPLSSASERPHEPITAGAPVGLGPGPSAEVLAPANRLSDLLGRMLENDMTGEIAEMYSSARRRGL